MKYAISVKTDTTTNYVYEADLSDVVFVAKLMNQIYSVKGEDIVVEIIGVNESTQIPDDSVCYWSSVELVSDNPDCVQSLSKGYISEIYSNAVDLTIPTSIGDFTIGVFCYYTDKENFKNPSVGAIDYDCDNIYVQFSDDAFSEKERDVIETIIDHYDFKEYQFGHEVSTEPTISKCSITYDTEGHPIVIISDIRFKGRRNIDWDNVKKYVKEYVGSNYEIVETSDKVFIGATFAEEIKGSEDTHRLHGTYAKAKANATSEIPMLLRTASNKRWQENYKSKHKSDASHGWYRFTSRFALPIYSEDGELERYNVFRVEMLVRHASDDCLYLYDMVNIKKETGNPL